VKIEHGKQTPPFNNISHNLAYKKRKLAKPNSSNFDKRIRSSDKSEMRNTVYKEYTDKEDLVIGKLTTYLVQLLINGKSLDPAMHITTLLIMRCSTMQLRG